MPKQVVDTRQDQISLNPYANPEREGHQMMESSKCSSLHCQMIYSHFNKQVFCYWYNDDVYEDVIEGQLLLQVLMSGLVLWNKKISLWGLESEQLQQMMIVYILTLRVRTTVQGS